ncbi:hypothetical protein [Paenibacillus antri]|nr:hypothetical protein [Paenibacillus antri]
MAKQNRKNNQNNQNNQDLGDMVQNAAQKVKNVFTGDNNNGQNRR